MKGLACFVYIFHPRFRIDNSNFAPQDYVAASSLFVSGIYDLILIIHRDGAGFQQLDNSNILQLLHQSTNFVAPIGKEPQILLIPILEFSRHSPPQLLK